MLTLDQAMSLFHQRGFDLLIADAAIYGAEGDERAADAIINPSVTAGFGRSFDCGSSPNPCGGASGNSYLVGVSDQGAIIENLVGKRPLRLKVARAALKAARASRIDAQRTLDQQVKAAYVQVALALENLRFAKETQVSSVQTLELNKLRYPKVIDEGALARIETTKLEADNGVDLADQAVRNARAGLAFLLGVRSAVPNFVVQDDALTFAVPSHLSGATEDTLMHEALTHRPDLIAQGFTKESAEAAVELAKRVRWPDIALGLQYTQTGIGDGAVSPPTLMFTVSATLPFFYAQEGEIQRAQASLTTQQITMLKTEAQVVNDVTNAWATYVSDKAIVERMESALLARATKARDITAIQFHSGSTTLMDFLDAQRTYIATMTEYLQDKANYWTAVYTLEQAVGMELRK